MNSFYNNVKKKIHCAYPYKFLKIIIYTFKMIIILFRKTICYMYPP